MKLIETKAVSTKTVTPRTKLIDNALKMLKKKGQVVLIEDKDFKAAYVDMNASFRSNIAQRAKNHHNNLKVSIHQQDGGLAIVRL